MVSQVTIKQTRSITAEAAGSSAKMQRTTPPAAKTAASEKAATEQTSPPGTAEIDPAALETAVRTIEKNSQNLQRSLQFSIDESSGKTVISVMDRQTGKLIRQIPQEEVLSLADHFGALNSGLVKASA